MSKLNRLHLAWMALALVLTVILLGGAATSDRQPSESARRSTSSAAGSGAAIETKGTLPQSPSSGSSALDGTGGSASTGAGGLADGLGKGSPQPIVLSPLELRRHEQEEKDNEHEDSPITPTDPNAPLIPGPDVPQTVVKEAPQAGSGATAAPSSPTDLVFFRNTDLGSGTGSLIGETSNATNGMVALETWNWGAAISQNGGVTWTYYNPSTFFPSAFGGFCCDQVAYYDQNHDRMFWVLQYSTNGSGNNAIRLAWASNRTQVANAQFCYTDFTPQQLGNPSGTNYDQPKFARSDNNVYLTIQRYGTTSGATVIRIANSQFSTYPTCSGVNYQFYFPNVYSPGFTQRAYGTMYFAGHASTSVLRVFSWPESVGFSGITSNDVTHTAYYVNYPMRCPRTGGSATSDWCQRRSFGGGWAHSDRIFTGWVTGGYINFMWDSTQGSGGGWGTKAYPFIDAAHINESTFALSSEPIMWNGSNAFVYAAAALNDNLYAAGTMMYGGGSLFEDCGVFIWDDISGTPPPWSVYNVRNSNSDPNDTLSGDYLATRRNGFNGLTWNGSCYALQGGSANANIHQYFLWFGRQRDFKNVFLPLTIK